jgi:hypothetical protein
VQTELLPLLDICKGGLKDGKCESDPKDGVVKKSGTDCCSGLCDTEFKLEKIISRKQCSACSPAELKAPVVPEAGTLQLDTVRTVGSLDVIIPKLDGST